MKIKIFNKRGGYDVNFGNLNIIRRQKNENHEYNLIIEGAFEDYRKLRNTNGKIFQKLAETVHMDWRKSIGFNNLTVDCITELVLMDKQKILLRRR